jgi:hypothetical protein
VFETGTIPRTFGLGETKRATRTSDEASTDCRRWLLTA